MNRRLFALILLVALSAAAPCAAEFADLRPMFVDRFDYSLNTSSITQIMQNSADAGFTDVVFQIRARGDAYYNSNFEPRASALGSSSFDPLQTAIDAAHSRGLKLHAWINSTNMWQGSSTPSAGHMFYNTNPSFRLVDINGTVEPQAGFSGGYSSVNPILPEVHTHINNVVNDIATNYDVDGINLDYIRYIPGNGFNTLPHDTLSHTLFNQATGLDGSNSGNTAAYRNYVKGRITDLVSSIKTTVDAAEVSVGRTIDLMATVWRDPDVGENDYMQDYRTWLEQDLLDIAMPMIYLSASNDHIFFDANLQNTLNISTNSRVAPVLASYLHVASGGGGVNLTLSEMQRAYDFGADGVGLYDYPAFFNGYSSADRQAVSDFYANLADPGDPDPTILADFEIDEGPLGWAYNTSPISQTFGLNPGTTIDRVTTEAQTGTGSQEFNLVGDASGWSLRHNSGIGSPGAPGSNDPFDATGFVGFWLKTEAAGMQVQIALDDPGTADRGSLQDIIADGEWHLYEWDLDDASQWDGWVTGDGTIVGPTVTLDSIFFYGAGDTLFYLDEVAHNPLGSLASLLPLLGDYDGNGIVDAGDYTEWRGAFGSSVTPGTGADGNGDGIVNAADYAVWLDNFGASSTASASGQESIPEPEAILLLVIGLSAMGQILPRVRKNATLLRT